MKSAVYLHKAKQSAVRRGHPWVFPKAIDKTTGKLTTGELVNVFSGEGELLAVGVYNAHSLYRVRILALVEEPIKSFELSQLILYRLKQASLLRQSLHLPSAETNAFRLFNSEADGLSGLTIDRFADIAVIASSAFWVEQYKAIILQMVQQVWPELEIIWLPQAKPLKQDGWELPQKEQEMHQTVVLEAGIQYQVNFATAQKTGLFLDQRENHQRIAALAQGKRVLDLYCYTGGFALHAARAGALQVCAVDSSAQAIASARYNAELNQLKQIEFIEADAREYLTKAGDYDLIVLDPPKLVPSERHIERAKNYYRFLHREIFKAMRSGSLLLTCNCSSALAPSEFSTLVSAQAAAVGKQARVLGLFGPAMCHPILAAFPQGNYLSALLVAVV